MDPSYVKRLAGEVLVAGFPGTEPDAHIERLIKHRHLRNVILFSRNVTSLAQIRDLTAKLQSFVDESGDDTPLIICTDQENGLVRRIAPDIPGLPGNMALGAADDINLVRRVGEVTAHQLLAAGVNMNLAPVLDVNNNPSNPVIGVRSYGEDPKAVAALGVTMIQGLQSSGVIACAKHFPGHGDTAVDSHLAVPTVPHPRARLDDVELAPFRSAIEAGVDVIMTAHVVFPAVDSRGIVATISPRVLTGLLRDELGYEGVITTDCLEMNAISETIGVGEGAVLALLAGADMVMVSHRIDRQEEALDAIAAAVENGRLPLARLEEAAARIRRLRTQRLQRSVQSVNLTEVTETAAQLQREASRASVTLVKNENGLLPVDVRSTKRIFVAVESKVARMIASDSQNSHSPLPENLRRVFPQCEIVEVTRGEDSSWTWPDVNGAELVVVGLLSGTDEQLLAQIKRLSDSGHPIVVMALQSPYVLKRVEGVQTALCLYEHTPWMVEAAADALVRPGLTAKLPVTVWG